MEQSCRLGTSPPPLPRPGLRCLEGQLSVPDTSEVLLAADYKDLIPP
jgi:hypothetical protein